MAKLYTKKTAYGESQPLIDIFNQPIVSRGARFPGNNDRYEIGQIWLNESTNQVWILTSYLAGVPVWTELDDAGGTGITWVTSAAANIPSAQNHGYYLTNAGAINCTLPLLAAVGSEIWIITDNSTAALAGINILQNAGQQVRYDAYSTTPGAGGSISWIGLGDTVTPFSISLQLICVVANTEWRLVTANRAHSAIV